MTDFVREAGRAGTLGVGFTGGEPLLLRSFESLARAARSAGLLTHLNTNGTLVTPDRARALLDTGLSSINISLDAPRAKEHDRQRGAGSFDQAITGIEALVRAGAASSARTRLLLALTLSEENAGGATDLLPLARELGVDGCTFLPSSRFVRTGARARAPSAARAAMDLLALEKDPLLDNSRRYLKGMVRFFHGAPMPGRCSAPHTSILVSSDRKLYPCVPSAVRGQGGEAYLPGAAMAAFRSGILRRCLDEALCRDCWWNCHRELDLALGVL
jgi:MoaA/NifB/PqqE/SkfB family radical SAM enzyme